MLLSRPLPPQFLLPAWGTRQLLCALQLAHQSTATGLEQSDQKRRQLNDERSHTTEPLVRRFVSVKGSDVSSRRRRKRLVLTLHNKAQHTHQRYSSQRTPNPTGSQLDDELNTTIKPPSGHLPIHHATSHKGLDTIGRREPLPTQFKTRQSHQPRSASSDLASLKSELTEDDPNYKNHRMMRRLKTRRGLVSHVPFGRPESTSESTSSVYSPYDPEYYRIPSLRRAEIPGRTAHTISLSSDDGTHKNASNEQVEGWKSMSSLDKLTRKSISNLQSGRWRHISLVDEQAPKSASTVQPERWNSMSSIDVQLHEDATNALLEKPQPLTSPSNDIRAKERASSVQSRLETPISSLDEQVNRDTTNVSVEKAQPSVSLSKAKRARKSATSAKTERPKPTGSLFDELFPEESKVAKPSEKKTVDKLPVFEWHVGPEIIWKEKAAEERKNWFHTVPELKTTASQMKSEEERRKRDLSVLVLSSASKTLEESDFFRLGEKGEHIEGWTSGIVKVIQGRDSQTLEPLGHYFLVFSNQTAATAYLDQMYRLHALSRTHGGWESPVPLPSRFLRPGEDVKTVLRGFSLVPGQSKLSLRLIQRPHSPAVVKVLSDGGLAAIAKQKTNSEDMVLFSVDMGPLTYWDVQHAITEDGKKRNLHWRLTEGQGAIVKVNVRNEEDESSDRRYSRAPPKFILSFQDSHEARRFVREWHRRPFPVQREVKLGDEPPPTINAEMFW